jgi:tetratricopeptide (TPR) repeat protein
VISPRLAALAIATVTLATFAGALQASFVEWDDQYNFLANPHYRGLGWQQLTWMFTTAWSGHWAPVTWLTLGLDWTLWGMDPVGYHLTSLLFHAAAAAVFFLLAVRLIAAARPGTSPAVVGVGAVVASLLFAIHPLRAESVAWVSERRDVVSGLGYLLAVLAYVRAADDRAGGRRGWLALSVGVYALAMMSKAIVMSLPIVLLTLDAYPLGRLRGQWRARLLEKVPYAAIALAGGAAAALLALDVRTVGNYPLWARPGVFGHALLFYLAKTLVPANLGPLYELPARWQPTDARLVTGLLGSIAITVGLVALRRRWPAGLAVWIGYAVTLAPVGGLAMQAGPQLVADRYTYLACLGPALLAGGAVARVFVSQAIAPRGRRLAAGGAVVAVAALGVLTWQQTAVWRDSVTLWRHATAIDPACAHCQNRLGASLHAAGASAAGLPALERAVALRPDVPDYHADLGQVLTWLGRPDAAVPHLARAADAYADNLELQTHLGAALTRAGRVAEGQRRLDAVLRRQPDHVSALTEMGFSLAAAGDPAAAVAYFERAITRAPRATAPRYGLTRAVAALGDHARAERELTALRALDPRVAAQAAAR